jgi:putative heme-binding domain-containing protein
MEILVRPKPGAREANGKLISFALVDIEVAPDGSLYLSDHNQGIWRVTYGEPAERTESNTVATVESLISIPQPSSEWGRLQEEKIRSEIGRAQVEQSLRRVAADSGRPLAKRLRAIRSLAPEYDRLPSDFLQTLAADPVPEIRGQAAWLLGIRGANANVRELLELFEDTDPFVRRRAAEALTRSDSPQATESLLDHLADPSRLIRFIAMAALAHRPASQWVDMAELRSQPQIRLRALAAASMRRERLPDEAVRRLLVPIFTQKTLVTEDRLDLLRVVVLMKPALDTRTETQVANYVLRSFPDLSRDVRWEQVRVLGEFGVTNGFGKLLTELESEGDHVTQFHIAQAIARLVGGWTPEQEERLVRWFLKCQRGWFAEFSGKGVEFPEFWTTVLTEFGTRHREALLRVFPQVELMTLLGGVAINLKAEAPDANTSLLALYRQQQQVDPKLKIVRALKKLPAREVSEFLRAEYQAEENKELQGAIVQTLATQPAEAANVPFFQEGLIHKEREVARASATALTRYKPLLTQPLARSILLQMMERRDLFRALEKLLVTLSGRTPPNYDPTVDLNRRPEEKAWTAGVSFWRDWYAQQFGSALDVHASDEKSDDEVHRFLMTDSLTGGDAARGGRIYESLQCQTCHGGGARPGGEGRIFGPDLAGVTRRLSREEFADSLVFPSKQVPDRFKGYELERTDGTTILGFITEQAEQAVTIVDQQQVHRIPRREIKSLHPQTNSLMPDRLINHLSLQQIRDLVAFLEQGAALGGGSRQSSGHSLPQPSAE